MNISHHFPATLVFSTRFPRPQQATPPCVQPINFFQATPLNADINNDLVYPVFYMNVTYMYFGLKMSLSTVISDTLHVFSEMILFLFSQCLTLAC